MNDVRRGQPEQGPQAQLSVPSSLLSDSLLSEAREVGVDAARAAADGIRRAVMDARAQRYTEQNREAAEAWNGYVAANGLPFDDIMERPT